MQLLGRAAGGGSFPSSHQRIFGAPLGNGKYLAFLAPLRLLNQDASISARTDRQTQKAA